MTEKVGFLEFWKERPREHCALCEAVPVEERAWAEEQLSAARRVGAPAPLTMRWLSDTYGVELTADEYIRCRRGRHWVREKE